jgi:hypothetical protein
MFYNKATEKRKRDELYVHLYHRGRVDALLAFGIRGMGTGPLLKSGVEGCIECWL